MNSNEIKLKMTTDDIVKVIRSLGEDIYKETTENLTMSTCLCHGGDSPNKLYYLKDSKSFYCQTHCGGLDIFSIVSSYKDITFPESIMYVCNVLGFSTVEEGFSNKVEQLEDDDWSFINSFKRKKEMMLKKEKESIPLDNNLMNMFQDIYRSEWLYDGISEEVMKRFNIKYSTLKQSIIIPHYDVENNLIGIRQRVTSTKDIELYGKYSPYSVCGEMYNHPLSTNLYGININKDAIRNSRKVMVVESEKGVLQAATMFGVENNFTVALCGCAKISKQQIKSLLDLNVREVILGLDRQYETVGDCDYTKWQKHIKGKFIDLLTPYFNVYVLWDTTNILGYKESPTDKGKDTLIQLMKNKILVEG